VRYFSAHDEDAEMETTSISGLAKRAQVAAGRTSSMASDMANQARDAASNASDSILAYTKKNPAKALGIAAVAGALLFALAKGNATRRN
jgi:ElaB/YqjD/DUF883 family membrane-anchored ribosome-binding protein